MVLRASSHRSTLFHLARRRVLKAGAGRPGGSNRRTGRAGADLQVSVPVGTVVLDAERGNVLKDLARHGEEVVVARGGLGGRGNAAFATATQRTPTMAEAGRPGERRRLRLELKLIADVGLVGLPNAGKSTLLSRLSAARPKVAAHPFTTLEPMLGTVEAEGLEPFVMADIPGLIEGAHRGRGLGDRFLRHVERTRVLLQLVDVSALAQEGPVRAWRVVREELAAYSPALARRPFLVVATKMDDPEAAGRAEDLERAVGGPVVRISAATGLGLRDLFAALAPLLAPEAALGEDAGEGTRGSPA